MKKLCLIIIFILIPTLTSADWATFFEGRYLMSVNNDVENSWGIKGGVGVIPADKEGKPIPLTVWLWGSYEFKHVLTEAGQIGLMKNGKEERNCYSPFGVGLGTEVNLNKYISIYTDIGYYFSIGNGKWNKRDEGQMLFWNERLSAWNYPFGSEMIKSYTKRVLGGFGAEATLKAKYDWKMWPGTWRMGSSVGYLFRNLPTYREGELDACALKKFFGFDSPFFYGNMQYRTTEDYGGPVFGLNVTVTF